MEYSQSKPRRSLCVLRKGLVRARNKLRRGPLTSSNYQRVDVSTAESSSGVMTLARRWTSYRVVSGLSGTTLARSRADCARVATAAVAICTNGTVHQGMASFTDPRNAIREGGHLRISLDLPRRQMLVTIVDSDGRAVDGRPPLRIDLPRGDKDVFPAFTLTSGSALHWRIEANDGNTGSSATIVKPPELGRLPADPGVVDTAAAAASLVWHLNAAANTSLANSHGPQGAADIKSLEAPYALDVSGESIAALCDIVDQCVATLAGKGSGAAASDREVDRPSVCLASGVTRSGEDGGGASGGPVVRSIRETVQSSRSADRAGALRRRCTAAFRDR